jgi:hypothetical protein
LIVEGDQAPEEEEPPEEEPPEEEPPEEELEMVQVKVVIAPFDDAQLHEVGVLEQPA